MTEKEESRRRLDDSFFRRLMAGLILALVVEGGSFIYYYGALVDRVDHIEKDVTTLKLIAGSLNKVDKSLEVLIAKVDYLATKLDKNGNIISDIRAEQNRRTGTIRNADDHIKDKSLHRHN